MRRVTGTPEEIFSRAGTELRDAIAQGVAARGAARLGIVGGRSIAGILDGLSRAIAATPCARGALHVVWLDERIGPEKNFLPVLPLLARLMPWLDVTWHPIVATTAEAALAECNAARSWLRDLDAAVVSAGEDGHIASLFPNHAALKARGIDYALVHDAPKPPPVRVTATPDAIRAARLVVACFVDKAPTLARFDNPHTTVPACPAVLVRGHPNVLVCVSP